MIPLAPIDVSPFAVGQGSSIDLSKVQGLGSSFPKAQPAHLYIFNDSGSGLQCMWDVGSGFNLPAGAWLPVPVPPNASKLSYTVIYLLPKPPVTLLLVTYFMPGEPLPPVPPVLGNSPVGIGGSITTSSVQTLSNEGNPANQLVIDVGDAAFSQLMTLYTDGHGVFAVDQGGVKHQIFLISTAGTPLKIGQAADTTEVLGNGLVDGTLTVTGDAAFNGAVTGLAIAANETIAGTLVVTGDATFNGAGIGASVANQLNAASIVTTGPVQAGTSLTSDGGLIVTDGSGKLTVGTKIVSTGEIDPNKASTTVAGSVAGNAIFNTAVWGSGLKILNVFLAGWNSASVAVYTFPSGITTGFYFSSLGGAATITWDVFIGGTAQAVRHMTSVGAANADGTDTAETAIHSDNIGALVLTGGAATSIQIGTTGGIAINGCITIIGF